MSSANSPPLLDLHLKPSVLALKVLFGIHLFAMAALLVAEPRFLPMLLAAGLLAGSWAWLRRHPVFGYGPQALSRLALREDATWWARLSNGREGSVALDAGTRIVAGRIFLSLDGATGKTSRLLLGDEIPAESLRRLRKALLTTGG